MHLMIVLPVHAIALVRGILVGVQVNSTGLQRHLGQVGPRVGACLSTGRRARPGGRGALRCRSVSCYRRSSYRRGYLAGRCGDALYALPLARVHGQGGHEATRPRARALVVAVWALRTSRKNTMAARKEARIVAHSRLFRKRRGDSSRTGGINARWNIAPPVRWLGGTRCARTVNRIPL